MGFEPQKFFVGLVDFFSVWLPGALLVYLLKDEAGLMLLGRTLPIDGTEAAVVFLFAAYLAGHFVFLLGASFDGSYDHIRHSTRHQQMVRLAQGGRLSGPFVRRVGEWLFAKDDKALRQALRIRGEHLDVARATKAINAFQWCKARLALDKPDALAAVERFEADSKFFRSLCAIILLLFAWDMLKQLALYFCPGSALASYATDDPGVVIGRSLALLSFFILSFWRYAERRSKATSQAYWFVLTAAHPEPVMPGHEHSTESGQVRSGGVVLSCDHGVGIHYLRVAARGSEYKWVLPKGHIEPHETAAEAAVREVLEESGIWARVHDSLRDIEFDAGDGPIKVHLFLMEYLAEDGPGPVDFHPWLSEPPPGDEARRQVDWKPLGQYGDLPEESAKAVADAAKRAKGAKRE